MELPVNPSKSLARLNPQLFGVSEQLRSKANDASVPERKLHDAIEAYARQRGWLVCHSRMDAPSTIAVGFPDFVIFMPEARAVFLECKRAGGKTTTAQLAKILHAQRLGFVAEIVTTFSDAILAMEKARA
jgi:hypothetical protein